MSVFPLTLVSFWISLQLWAEYGSASPMLHPRPGYSQPKGYVEGPTVLKKEVAMKKIAVFFDVNIKQKIQESFFWGTPLTP